MAVKTYDTKAISIIISGQIASGFADGTFLLVDFDEDAYLLQIGVDGEGARSKSNNNAGTFTITLQQTASFNLVLSAVAEADRLSNSGIFPVLVNDNGGFSIHSAETAWIQKVAPSEYAREAGSREWVIRTDNMFHFPGGN